MKTITYNPETHVLVPREPTEDMLRSMTDGFISINGDNRSQFNSGYASMLAAAPQPEPNHNWCAGCSPDNCSGCGGEPAGYVAHGSTLPRNIRVFKGCSILSKEEADEYMPECVTALYTTPQPDRTAELEQLRQQVADLEKERDELIEVKAAENASWNAGFNVQVDQLKKLTAERDAALNEARDFESDVDTVTQHNVELQLENATAWAQAHRLALELECLLLDTKDNATVSKWWDSGMEALNEYQRLKPGAKEDAEAWAKMRKGML